MNGIFRKIAAAGSAVVLAFSTVLPVSSFTPVLANETYYTYDYYSCDANGTTVTSVNLPVAKAGALVLQWAYGTNQYITTVFYLFASSNSAATAKDTFTNKYVDPDTLLYIPKRTLGNGWTFSTALNWPNGRFEFTNSSGNSQFLYTAAVMTAPGQSIRNSYGAYAPRGTPMLTNVSSGYPGLLDAVNYYIAYSVYGIDLPSGWSVGSYLGGWHTSGDTNVPVIDMSTLGTPTGTGSTPSGNIPDSGTSGGDGGTDATFSQNQWIAEGAIDFTVEDGAFSQTQTQTQTIEENAINVTVNNDNSLDQDNSQYLNNIINNNLGTSGDTFEEAIGTISGFTSIARSFANLTSAVLGFLPSWILNLIALTISLLLIFIVFRLIHLFV